MRLSAASDFSAYQIGQEALTYAIRQAGAVTAHVRLRYRGRAPPGEAPRVLIVTTFERDEDVFDAL